MSQHTKGPWHLCKNGKCKCNMIMSDHHPICTFTRGVWGDEWDELREHHQGGPYIEHIMLEYGKVPSETAEANARLIAASPLLLESLIETMNWISEECQPDAEFVAKGHNWNMSDDDRKRGIDIMSKAHAAIAAATGEEA